MRIIILTIFVAFALSISASIREQDVDSVVIKYVSWNIITDIGIDCTNFERSFEYQIVTKNNANTMSQLLAELDNLKIAQRGGEDTRCKLDFYHSGNVVQSCCLGCIITKIGSTYYYTTPSLMAAIDSLVATSPTRNKTKIDLWDPSHSIEKVSKYLSSQAERIYKDVIIDEDLSFTVFCYVGEGGKTLSTRFTKNRKEGRKDVPAHIISIIQEILTKEITWDIPKNNPSQWIPINISIKSNAHSNDNKGNQKPIEEFQSKFQSKGPITGTDMFD